jgi:hypothetical protein
MAKLVTIALATLRFVATLAVGLFLLLALDVALLFAGAGRFQGIVLVVGLVLTISAATRIAVRGRLNTFDRAAAPLAAGVPARIFTIALATLRFVAALAVGLFLLFVLNVTLLFAGVERFNGFIFLAGLVLTVSAAMRIAVRGRLNTFDRAAGTAAASVSALVFAGMAVAVAGGLGLLAIVWFLAHFGFGPGAFVWINSMFEHAMVFIAVMQIGIGASLAATWLLWWRRNGRVGPKTQPGLGKAESAVG